MSFSKSSSIIVSSFLFSSGILFLLISNGESSNKFSNSFPLFGGIIETFGVGGGRILGGGGRLLTGVLLIFGGGGGGGGGGGIPVPFLPSCRC
jgi:hypothetical protein